MKSSLLNLVNNLSEYKFIELNVNSDNDKKCGRSGIEYKYCDCFLNTQILKMI